MSVTRVVNEETGAVAYWDDEAGRFVAPPGQPLRGPAEGAVGEPVASPLSGRPLGPLMPPEVAGGYLSQAAEVAKRAALPAAGGTLGGLLGAAVGGPSIAGAPLAVLGGEALGAGAGEALNQRFGITEPSLGQVGLAAAAGPVTRGVGFVGTPVKRFLTLRLPGASAGVQEAAVGEARGIAGRFAGAPPELLYQAVDRLNPIVPVNNLNTVVNELLAKEAQRAPGLKSGPIEAALKGLRQIIDEAAGALPFQQLRLNMQRIGERTGSAAGAEADEIRGAYKLLTRAIQRDLDQAVQAGGVVGQPAILLREANKAYRRESAVEEVGQAIEKGVNKGRPDLLESFNAGRARKALEADDYLRQSFEPGEWKDILSLVSRLKGLPALPPQTGLNVGSRLGLRQAILGGAGGFALGGGEGALYGAAAAEAASMMVGKALTTERGRAYIRGVLGRRGSLDWKTLAVLGQIGRAGAASPSLPE